MLEIISACLWAIVTLIILIIGTYFSLTLCFPQFNIKKIKKHLFNKNYKESLKTLNLTLAGRIGVGSISGVALAIYLGGPGTIFWMWIVAFITGSLAYTETFIAIIYKEKTYGGPSYYIKKGLKNKKLAIMYAFIIIISYLIGFIPIQSNTIAKSLDVNKIIIGFSLSLISFFIIKGGLKKITKATNILVPIMTLIYILICLIAIINNIDKFITITNKILTSALNVKSFFTSFIPTLLIGIQRCIFSNESGTGIGSIAASSSKNQNPSQNGYIQIIGIYMTTLLICTITAFLILTSPYQTLNLSNLNGIEITSFAFNYHFKSAGKLLLNISIILFSFTTILTGYYYCESSINFISNKINKKVIKIFVPISVFLGTIFSPTTIWKSIDIMVAILVLINIYTLYKLRKEILKYHKKYDRI